MLDVHHLVMYNGEMFQGDLPPNNENFIKYLLKLFNSKNTAEFTDDTERTISLSDFVKDMQIIMRDEFNGVVTIKAHDLINIVLDSGEQFNIKIEKI